MTTTLTIGLILVAVAMVTLAIASGYMVYCVTKQSTMQSQQMQDNFSFLRSAAITTSPHQKDKLALSALRKYSDAPNPIPFPIQAEPETGMVYEEGSDL